MCGVFQWVFHLLVVFFAVHCCCCVAFVCFSSDVKFIFGGLAVRDVLETSWRMISAVSSETFVSDILAYHIATNY